MTGPDLAWVRIDRIVVETDHPVNGFALQVALGDALRRVVAERGLPSGWLRDGAVPAVDLGELGWDGRGGAPALARELAERLHEASDRSAVAANPGPGRASRFATASEPGPSARDRRALSASNPGPRRFEPGPSAQDRRALGESGAP